MNIDNIKENNLYFYPTNSFATIKIKLRFLLSNDEKELIKVAILCRYLKKTNKKYQTFKSIRDQERYFYDMNINIKQTYVGSKNFFNFSAKLISPRVIKDNYLESAFEFLHDILFNPNFTNNKLDSEVFNEIKKSLINEEKKAMANPKVISKRDLFSSIVPNSNIITNTTLDIDEFTDIINNTTDEDIINLYNKIINESFYRGYLFGDITDDEFNKFITLFPFKNSKEVLDYRDYQDIPFSTKEVINKDIKTSDIYVIYKLNNFDISKQHIYKTLNYMISSSIGLSQKILREERGLVYSSGAYINKYRFFGFLMVGASLSEENKDICLDGIDEIFRRLKDENIVSKLLEYAKEKQNQLDYLSDENIEDVLSDLGEYIFETSKTREELHNLINSLTTKDIINEIDNIEKRYVYFYRGSRK